MKKQFITIIITAIVVSLLDFGIFYLCKDIIFKDNNSVHDTNNTPNDTPLSYDGTYIVTYTDKAGDLAANTPSILILKDNIYKFVYNTCNSIEVLNGNFKMENNTLTLLNSKDILKKDKDITFTIVNDKEIYLNDWLSCVIDKEAYQNGYGSFKKIN